MILFGTKLVYDLPLSFVSLFWVLARCFVLNNLGNRKDAPGIKNRKDSASF